MWISVCIYLDHLTLFGDYGEYCEASDNCNFMTFSLCNKYLDMVNQKKFILNIMVQSVSVLVYAWILLIENK